MSSYFDKLADLVRRGPRDDDAFLAHVREVEGDAYSTITALTGDREFPDDLREQILGIFAVHGVFQLPGLPRNSKAECRALACQGSRCLERLHDAFHDVARRRHQTRFGRLSDHPQFDLARRDAEDSGGTQ